MFALRSATRLQPVLRSTLTANRTFQTTSRSLACYEAVDASVSSLPGDGRVYQAEWFTYYSKWAVWVLVVDVQETGDRGERISIGRFLRYVSFECTYFYCP
jgi:hypothetical protein